MPSTDPTSPPTRPPASAAGQTPRPPIQNNNGYGWTPPPAAPPPPVINMPAGWTGDMGSLGYVPQITAPAYGGGNGGAPAPAPTQEGPYGNWFDPTAGPHGEWKDAWGNVIPHMNFAPGGGDQNPANQPAAVPAGPVAGAGLPAPAAPPWFYAPSTGTNTLTLPQNFMQYLTPEMRAQFNQSVQQLGFTPTGQFGPYGESSYTSPANLSTATLDAVSDPNIRQWLRFFLGQLGYGLSYQLPSVPGYGQLPPAPPTTAPPAALMATGARGARFEMPTPASPRPGG